MINIVLSLLIAIVVIIVICLIVHLLSVEAGTKTIKTSSVASLPKKVTIKKNSKKKK